MVLTSRAPHRTNYHSDYELSIKNTILYCLYIDIIDIMHHVFRCLGRLEKEDLNSKLGKLSKKIKQVKEELYESLRAVYVDSDPCFDMSTSFYERVQSMKEEIQSLENKIDKDVCNKRRTIN